MMDVLVLITCILRSSEISISWYLMNAFFLLFFVLSSWAKRHFFFFLIFIFASPRTVNGKNLCRKQLFRPGFQTATFVPLFLGFTVIRRYDDRYVNRRSPISAPVSHPILTMSRARRTISTQRDEATNTRNVAICIFQRIANPTRAYLSLVVVRLPVRNLSRQMGCFFFNVNHSGCEFVSVWQMYGYKFDMEVQRATNCEFADKEKSISVKAGESNWRYLISFVI